MRAASPAERPRVSSATSDIISGSAPLHVEQDAVMLKTTVKTAPRGRLLTSLRADWAFESATRARASQPLFQYPAMMVSPMQGALLDAVIAERERPPHVMDPFVGSGTTMLEARRRGLRFTGVDINPLAILLCQVEASEVDTLEIERAAERVSRRARRALSSTPAPTGAWVTKWYRPDVARSMAALQQTIKRIDELEVRRALWVALAELARVAGNQRPNAPKLQTRPAEQLDRELDIFARFLALSLSTAAVVGERNEELAAQRAPSPDLRLTDARRIGPLAYKADLLLTSPPYGDNHTTMPYGQVAFLPLRWIELADIDPSFDRNLTARSQTLDTASLGGSLQLDECVMADTMARSTRLTKVLQAMGDRPPHARARTASFFCDLDQALGTVCDQLSPDAHAVLTLGGKTTYGIPVPTAAIVEQLLKARGFRKLQQLTRTLRRNRRMPTRNERSGLICKETVLVMRRET
jgi:16S rRNA G966 N2-methylase RsmD